MYDYPLFQEKPLIPTRDAQHEMDELRLDLWRVKEILEQGYTCRQYQIDALGVSQLWTLTNGKKYLANAEEWPAKAL